MTSTPGTVPDTTSPSPGSPGGDALFGERGYQYRWMVMAVVILADVMDLLDATVANLAGPSIRRDIGGGESTLQWILAAYTLTFAVGLITSARLGDLVGRRRMFVIGMVGFTVASLACGLAPSAGLLIGARAIQGLFGAAMIPQGFAMVKASFHEDDLQKAFIPFGPIMGLAAVIGPILAGVLINADLFGSGWRLIFWINVPVGLIASYLAWRYLPRNLHPDPNARLDIGGSVLITAASVLLIYPLVQGRDEGWPWWMFLMFAGSAAFFAAFVLSERRSTHPIIEPSLFSHGQFIGGLVFLGSFFTAMSGFNLAGNLFIQYGLHYSPLHTGLTMIPLALGMAIGAASSGAALGPKFGRKVLHGGLIGVGIGMLVLWWTSGHQGLAVTGWQLAPAFLITGIGMGVIFAPLFDIILAALGDNEVGTGSGLLNAVQQFCGALGVAVLGSAYFHWLPDHGFVTAIRWLILLTIACFAASFLIAFVLPRHAREDGAH
jgi:EmrB/QacA subfamily drug resistance transporter